MDALISGEGGGGADGEMGVTGNIGYGRSEWAGYMAQNNGQTKKIRRTGGRRKGWCKQCDWCLC